MFVTQIVKSPYFCGVNSHFCWLNPIFRGWNASILPKPFAVLMKSQVLLLKSPIFFIENPPCLSCLLVKAPFLSLMLVESCWIPIFAAWVPQGLHIRLRPATSFSSSSWASMRCLAVCSSGVKRCSTCRHSSWPILGVSMIFVGFSMFFQWFMMVFPIFPMVFDGFSMFFPMIFRKQMFNDAWISMIFMMFHDSFLRL